MKQYLFDTNPMYHIAMCTKQQAVRKFILAQNVNKIRNTFTLWASFWQLFFGSLFKSQGWIGFYENTTSRIQEDVLTHPTSSTFYFI